MQFQKNTILDKLFWIFLFLFTDPGGFQQGYFERKLIGQINFSDIIFVILSVLYFLLPNKHTPANNKLLRNFLIIILIWLLYYVFVFGLFNNHNDSFTFFLIKSRYAIYTVFIAFYCANFTFRNTKLFFENLRVFSFIIFFLFFITVITNLPITPLMVFERGFVNTDRLLMYSYSFLPYLIPIALILSFFKFPLKGKNIWILLGSLMLVTWILSLTRRHMLFTILYTFIILFLAYKFGVRKSILSPKLVLLILIPILFLSIFFKNYAGDSENLVNETISLITTGETSSGTIDKRISLTANYFIIGKFLDNQLFGTGYDYLWNTEEGDKLGYESTDYPFLATLAQFGIIGLLLFCPVYFFVYNLLIKVYKDVRNEIVFQSSIYDSILFLLITSVLILNIFLFTYWFYPANINIHNFEFYVFVGMLIGIQNRNTFHTFKHSVN